MIKNMDSNIHKRYHPDNYIYKYPIKKQKIVLYLPDHTPIRTVEVTNLHDHVCPGYLRAYFECEVGPVDDVLIITHKLEGNQKIRVGYVTFTFPEDAAKLICDSNLPFNCKFKIKQAANVFQPKIDPNALKFEAINNDCLTKIVSFLNLIDTINLGKTSGRLQSFVDQEIYAKRTHFEFGALDLSINKRNLPTILEEMGKHFKSIEWVSLNDRQIDQLSEHCRNVIALHLVDPNLHLNSLERNADWFKNLRSLKIVEAHFFDAHIKAMIGASTQLESLQLIDCHKVQGNFLAEWKDSELKDLRIVRCPAMSPSNVAGFLRNSKKLIKFSSDGFDSFIMCLSLPTPCLYGYTELELAVNATTDGKLDLLQFVELKQLLKIDLKSTFYNDRIDKDVTVAKDFNNIFVAMSPVALTTLIVERIIVDADTFKCLGAIQSLREVDLKNIYNGVGTEMYSSLTAHLPKITKLSMSMVNKSEREPIEISKAISDMIFGLADLKYLSHSNMTWELLNDIRNVQMIRKQPSTLEIGISPLLFQSLRKAEFVTSSEGAVLLSLAK